MGRAHQPPQGFLLVSSGHLVVMARHKDTTSSTAVQSPSSTDTGAHRAEADPTVRDRVDMARARRDDSEARDKFGGMNLGAGFFGWLVAMGMTILLFGIIGA